MKKLVQINTEATGLSTGRIAEGIGNAVLSNDWESHICYGRKTGESNSIMYPIGNKIDAYIHALDTRILGRTGASSKKATKDLINYIEKVKPSIIQIHNLHGYYINYKILFDYLNTVSTPVVWSFHDLWPITGHCTQFENVGCEKWKTTCHTCPQLNEYPKSMFFDRSTKSHNLKKALFTRREQLQLVTSSNWSKNRIKESFLKDRPITVIPNGINTEQFHPISNDTKRNELNLQDKYVLLGVAGVWTNKKGLQDFLDLSLRLQKNQIIILIGLNDKQLEGLPNNIIGIKRTANINELAAYYSMADIFLNLTYADTFPTTNLEALGCGTPIITYDTGGSIESVFENAGKVVEKGDLNGVLDAINELSQRDTEFYKNKCTLLAQKKYHMQTQFDKYRKLYDTLLKESKS